MGEIEDVSGDSVEFWQTGFVTREEHVHVSNELIDREVNEGEIAQKPATLILQRISHKIFILTHPRKHIIFPLFLFELLQCFLWRFLCTVYVNNATHCFYGP